MGPPTIVDARPGSSRAILGAPGAFPSRVRLLPVALLGGPRAGAGPLRLPRRLLPRALDHLPGGAAAVQPVPPGLGPQLGIPSPGPAPRRRDSSVALRALRHVDHRLPAVGEGYAK
jgi:hypothetical protein